MDATKQRCGDIEIIKRIRCWHDCELCDRPAKYRITFLLNDARNNPHSSAYKMDDCSWCSDAELFACEQHKEQVRTIAPREMKWCASFALKSYKHMGFYWLNISDELAKLLCEKVGIINAK